MRVTITALLLTALLGAMAMWHFSAHKQAERKIRAALEEISIAADAQNQEALFGHLDTYFSPEANIELNVSFKIFAMGSNNGRGWEMQHNREQFKNFIARMIGKVDGYGMRLNLEELKLDENDPTRFDATVSASGFATGATLMMGRSVGTRYVIRGDCTTQGTVAEKLQVTSMLCPISLNQQADLQGVKVKDVMKQLQNVKP